MAQNPEALSAFMGHVEAARAMLTGIEAGIQNYLDEVEPKQVHWAHAGDMAELAHRLRQALDFVNRTEQ